jgi:hypothetical protein
MLINARMLAVPRDRAAMSAVMRAAVPQHGLCDSHIWLAHLYRSDRYERTDVTVTDVFTTDEAPSGAMESSVAPQNLLVLSKLFPNTVAHPGVARGLLL